MKPEQLLKAMEHISADYIAEAKPHTELHQESRVGQPETEKPEKKVIRKHDRRPAPSGTGKDISMSSQSAAQRIITGAVAAAACAVFIGGGIFIAQQAKQNRPGTANSGNDIAEQTNLNFLGEWQLINQLNPLENKALYHCLQSEAIHLPKAVVFPL